MYIYSVVICTKSYIYEHTVFYGGENKMRVDRRVTLRNINKKDTFMTKSTYSDFSFEKICNC